MCGIVGLFLKRPGLEGELGALLAEMLVTLSDRGPDSAGFAVYGTATAGTGKLTVRAADPAALDRLAPLLRENGIAVTDEAVVRRATHAVVSLPAAEVDGAARAVAAEPELRVMSRGEAIEIYKEVGAPKWVAGAFGLTAMTGTHAIGHTRMATESAVTTMGAHPFSTGPDQCLVHNGSLSNHNNLRRVLVQGGARFETENDSEVAAAYITARLAKGRDLGEALSDSLSDLDGFYTFVVGTRSGFGVLRDPVACKPAVLAETDDYVAFGSEYRALASLPGIDDAKVWEPEPANPYFWQI